MNLNRESLALIRAFFAQATTANVTITNGAVGVERRIFVGPGGGVFVTEEINVLGVNYRDDFFLSAATVAGTPGIVATTIAARHAAVLAAIAAGTP